MSGLKDNTGYDFASLLVGSEGTLAVITRVRLRLVPHLPARVVAIVAVASVSSALSLLAALQRRPLSLEACEIFFADGLDLVCDHAGLRRPFRETHDTFALVECAAYENPTDALVAELAEHSEIRDAIIGRSASERAALWAYRERHTDAISAAGVPLKLDVAVPLERLPAFASDVRKVVRDVGAESRAVLYGHLGDGNLHVNVLGAPDEQRMAEAVLRLVADHHGSISAEHGIGVAKARWLALTRSDDDIATMRAIKVAFDPQGLLNPGVLFAEPVSLLGRRR